MRGCLSIAIFAAAFVACPGAPRAPERDQDPEAPLSCKDDRDCGVLACGPCTKGAIVRASAASTTCVVNPCPGTRSHCNADHVCAVE